MGQADYRRAITCLGQAVASFDRVSRHERLGQVTLPAVTSRFFLSRCYAQLGMFTKGRSLAEEGLRIAEAVADPASLLFAARGIGAVALRQGNLTRALPYLERAIAICQDADHLANFRGTAEDLASAYTLGGRVTDAMVLLARAIEQSIVAKDGRSESRCYHIMGEAQMLFGRLEEAHAFAEHAMVLAHELQERVSQAYTLRLLGEIASRREPPARNRAETAYQQALALAEELGMGPLQAHCHLGLGTLYAKTDQPEQARAELSTAIALYRAMEMTFWLPRAEATLAGVAGSGSRDRESGSEVLRRRWGQA